MMMLTKSIVIIKGIQNLRDAILFSDVTTDSFILSTATDQHSGVSQETER